MTHFSQPSLFRMSSAQQQTAKSRVRLGHDELDGLGQQCQSTSMPKTKSTLAPQNHLRRIGCHLLDGRLQRQGQSRSTAKRMNLAKSKSDRLARLHFHLMQRLASATFQLIARLKSFLCRRGLPVPNPRLARTKCTLAVPARGSEPKRRLQVHKILQKDVAHLCRDTSAEHERIHLSLLGLEHQSLLHWIPHLALELLVFVGARAPNAQNVQQLRRAHKAGRLHPGCTKSALITIQSECPSLAHELTKELCFP